MLATYVIKGPYFWPPATESFDLCASALILSLIMFCLLRSWFNFCFCLNYIFVDTLFATTTINNIIYSLPCNLLLFYWPVTPPKLCLVYLRVTYMKKGYILLRYMQLVQFCITQLLSSRLSSIFLPIFGRLLATTLTQAVLQKYWSW